MKDHVIIYGENLYDVCISVYGNLEALKDLMADNPVLTSWSMDISGLAGQSLVYDETKYNILPAQVNATSKIKSSIAQITGQYNQSVFDILMLTYLSFDNMLKLLLENGFTSFDLIDANTKNFDFDTRVTQKPELYNYMNNLAPAKPATLYEQDATVRILESGEYRLTENGIFRFLE